MKLINFYMTLSRGNRVFIDTSAFIAFVLDSESYHENVIALFNKCFRENVEMITTDYVLDELITFLRCREKVGMDVVLSFLKSSYSSGIKVFGISEELFGAALALMVKYRDHYFSSTDCVSFLVMRDLGIENVLTLDKDFEIAGFKKLI